MSGQCPPGLEVLLGLCFARVVATTKEHPGSNATQGAEPNQAVEGFTSDLPLVTNLLSEKGSYI